MAYNLYLMVVAPDEHDNVLVADQLPMFRGIEDQSLACGRCGGIMSQGISTWTIRGRFAISSRLLIRCLCGVHNLVPEQTMPE
jgi:hypothetical protein